MSRDLDSKLADFDRHADLAVTFLLGWLDEHRDYLIIQARGRLIRGHYAFGDKFLYELSSERLLGEASEELADAVNYVARRLDLNPSASESPSAASGCACAGDCPSCP